MRVVFMGTPEFAVPSLQALNAAAEVVAVYTRPDAVSGRGRRTRPSPVALAAGSLGIPLRQPASLKDLDVQAELKAFAPDLLVVAAYGLILPAAVLDAAALGAINVHASLLPRWRGAAPIQRAVLAGDQKVGVSIMRMEVGLDTGPYCLQRAMPVAEGDAVTLTSALAELGANALLEAFPSIIDGTASWIEQDPAKVTYADKIAKSDVALSPDISAEFAVRRIRASSAAAPCRIAVGERRLTLLEATTADDLGGAAPARGALVPASGGVLLGTADGTVLVTRLKPDGKGAMAAADWARGVHQLDTSGWDTHL